MKPLVICSSAMSSLRFLISIGLMGGIIPAVAQPGKVREFPVGEV